MPPIRDAADGFLRLAFYHALNPRGDADMPDHGMSQACINFVRDAGWRQRVWVELYQAVISTESGLETLAYMQRLEDENQRLRAENDHLRAQVNPMPTRLPVIEEAAT